MDDTRLDECVVSALYYSCLESLASVSVCTKTCFINCGKQESLKYVLLCNVWLANLRAALLARGSDFVTELVNLRLVNPPPLKTVCGCQSGGQGKETK